MISSLFFSQQKVGKAKHRQKQHERSLEKVLFARNKAELSSSRGQVQGDAETLFKQIYMVCLNSPNRKVVIPFSHKLGHTLVTSAKTFYIPGIFSASKKLGGLCVELNKCLKEQPQCEKMAPE